MPSRPCKHAEIQLDVSPHAGEAGFSRPLHAKRLAAATASGRVSKTKSGEEPDHDDEATTTAKAFPGPLVLPDDALSIDPKEPPQSLRSWIREGLRNPFTSRRKTIYVAPPPSIPAQLSFLKKWCLPRGESSGTTTPIQPPRVSDIVVYLEAFYHPLPVKLLAGKIAFQPWTATTKSISQTPTFLGLQIGSGVTRIRTRATPDGVFSRQLNLNDVLDAAIDALPVDAYALVMLSEHDLYEDEDDDFCCGRAYGNSRVAVVSGARYHPGLDGSLDPLGGEDDDADAENVRMHMWPTSHCARFVSEACAGGEGRSVKPKGKASAPEGMTVKLGDVQSSPIGAAIEAVRKVDHRDLSGLWFSRIARTASHELGHCLCLGHCVYYACVMQGTAGLAEDLRQPPYLCPVCLAKVTRAIAAVAPSEEAELMVERYAALRRFCQGWLGVGMFAGYHAWLEKRLEALA